MKRIHTNSATHSTHPVLSNDATNLMEGVPASMPALKASAESISSRPHILAKRNTRWNRRASH